jgi:hypothetical protein
MPSRARPCAPDAGLELGARPTGAGRVLRSGPIAREGMGSSTGHGGTSLRVRGGRGGESFARDLLARSQRPAAAASQHPETTPQRALRNVEERPGSGTFPSQRYRTGARDGCSLRSTVSPESWARAHIPGAGTCAGREGPLPGRAVRARIARTGTCAPGRCSRPCLLAHVASCTTRAGLQESGRADRPQPSWLLHSAPIAREGMGSSTGHGGTSLHVRGGRSGESFAQTCSLDRSGQRRQPASIREPRPSAHCELRGGAAGERDLPFAAL